ncbi:uncharacterized protein LOC123721776 [Papilio machaon]|uniref:uncharacterized protein LOC123721776 n=1 Tax=Papilio machaon TaxID=76193 RepID=UPI001E666011|nr:uncharacterized protein LOC123721776 [Papilio machaon]
MLIVRTINRLRMNSVELWLCAATLQLLLLTGGCQKHHRRAASHGALPVSKSGWRPVVSSNGLVYGSFGTAPLHAPQYKLPVYDLYPSSARPVATRDAAKLTSIAQSYRPTTHRTVSAPPAAPGNQPINSYLNPFALPNNGLSHFKYFQTYPLDSYVVRNSHNQFAQRPQQKHPNKHKQPTNNNLLQQLTSIQPIHFGQYQTQKPLDLYSNPIDSYGRPIEGGKRPQTVTEIYKPEVYQLPDTTSQQQEVKTAQQQTFSGYHSISPLANYAFQDSALPSSLLGSFGSFGVQSVKAREPAYPTTKSYVSPQPTKQTIFNSFSYTSNNNFKSTPSLFSVTTPKLQTIQNQYQFGTTVNDFRNIPTPQTKVSNHPKIDPNANGKGIFKPSPQDPFIKPYQSLDFNKITTYNPVSQTTTLPNSFYYTTQHNVPIHNNQNQQNAQIQNYQSQQNLNYKYENKKNIIHDNIAAGVNQQNAQKYADPPKTQLQETPSKISNQGHYEVTENHEDIITHSSPWMSSPETNRNNLKASEESALKQETFDAVFRQTTTTPYPDVTDEFVIVTESEKGYENSLSYDGQVETQSRKPSEDEFEPINRNKLKDYYYKVSTPSYGDHTYARRTKKPTEASKLVQPDVTTSQSTNNDINVPIEALPTLPPNKHFKRPSTPEPLDKDRIRKRNKIRRRRPGFANGNRNNQNKEETTTRRYEQPSSEPTLTTTVTEEVYTIRPRVRPSKQEQGQTTPSVTTDLTTSALPTISPTVPSVVRRKIAYRRPLTTPAEKFETTTVAYREPDTVKESPIMKISSRPQLMKLTSSIYEYKSSEVPDYTHKQDEKDTPTSDVSVSLTDSLKSSDEIHKEFSFHRDVKPVEIKETTTDVLKENNDFAFDATTTARPETTTRTVGKRLRPKNKLDRPKFNVKDYRNRLSSTTSTTEKTVENTPRLRYAQRKVPYTENLSNDNDNATDRKRFTPKDPRHRHNRTENNEQLEREIHSTRQAGRQRQTTIESESTTQKISSRIRNGSRRPRPTEDTTETSSTSAYSRRPLRKKIKDSETGESVQDISVTDASLSDVKSEITSERSRSESAIMKIADKKHQDHIEHLFEQSKRVSDLTLAASKDYSNPGMFKTVSGSSRRIPNYFTIATDDPILPIEAFFPQLNQKKES